MKTRYVLLFVLFLSLFVSCSDKGDFIEIVETSFEEEVPLTGHMTFTFNRDIVSENDLNVWDSITYIEFEPEIPGNFMWTSVNTLAFSPMKKLSPSTDYKGTFTKEFLSEKGFQMENKSFDFHTPYLKVERITGYWSIIGDNKENAFIHFTFDFNYNVRPEEVADYLSVEIDGETRDINLISKDVDQRVQIYVPGITLEDKTYNSVITLKEGLKAAYGTIAMKEKTLKEVEIPSPFKFNITFVDQEHDGNTGKIHIYTSQKVDAKNLKSSISLQPSAHFDIEVLEQEFIIKSDEFDVSKPYKLTLKEGIKGVLGGALKFDFEQDISFGQLEPAIKFLDSKNIYLTSKGSKEIEVNITSIPKVKVTVYKVYENNLISFLGNRSYYYDDYYYDDYYYDDYYYDDYSYQAGELGDIVYEEEIDTRKLKKNGNNKLLKLDFKDKIEGYQGIYLVKVSSLDDYWIKASKVVSISDIGLIIKEGKKSVTVFANSIKTAEPLANVDLTFIGKNNQVTGKAKTDVTGVAVFELSDLPADGFKVKLITASLANDFNYILFNQAKINNSRFDIGGRSENYSGFEAFIYGDRDIYRPGETINISGILRDWEWGSPGELPVKLKIYTPNGKEYKTFRKTLNAQGAFDASFSLPASAMTGSYSAALTSSTDVYISTYYFKVEEFMPDRIKVKAELDKEEYKPGETIYLDIHASNLFGPPAAGRNWEVDQSFRRKYFSPEKNRDYDYYIQGAETYFRHYYDDGKTDENGNANLEFIVPSHYAYMGILEADYYITVFDETGRPVSKRKQAEILTQDVFYGIQNEYGYYKVGSPVRIPVIAVDKKGNEQSNVSAEIQLIKHEYKTVLNKSGGYFRYRSEHEEIVLDSKVISIDGTSTSYEFIPDNSGRYEFRISAPGINTYVTKTIYCYGYGRTSFSSFKVDNEGQIDIELDKSKYNVGDQAEIILKTPFEGKVLITIENDNVVRHFYETTDKRALSLSLDITDDLVPNVYITATLFKPHEKTDLPFTVAHGFAPVIVENPANKIPIEIEAAKQSRSRTKQTIKIKSEPNSNVTIAVVDEGILQVTGFKTPDPYNFFYGKRSLGVNSYNIYPYLFPELSVSASGGGGPMDGDEDGDKRLNPLTNKRVNLVAFWSGILETDNRGNAEFEVNIPQYSGDLRIMVVGYKNKVFGSETANMQVADPIVISASIPRFLSPGDTLEVPVMLANTTSNTADCNASISVDGPLEVIGKKEIKAGIKPNKEGIVTFRLLAKKQIGNGKITVTAAAMGENFINETEITIRPASPLIKTSGNETIKAGQKKLISMDAGSFIPSSMDNKLIVSKSPLVKFSKDLEYLVSYPYGCVEQTVSSAFPQLYYGDLVKDILGDSRDNLVPAYNVREAIKRLSLMQLYNGGLTYWPQSGSESWWGTVYAAHFLLEAKKAGFEVDQDFLNKMFEYIEMKLKSKEKTTYYYNNTEKREIYPREVPYSLYVLAMANKPQRSTMNFYKSNKDALSLDGKYMLAAAYAISGDTRSYKQILPEAFEGEVALNAFGGSFYSHIRDEAISLNVLLDVDPENTQVPVMARHISKALETSRYLNTQERVFSFLAMGKIAKQAGKNDVTATITCNGKQVGKFQNKTLTLNTKELNGTEVSVSVDGTGELYCFWEAEGISADGSYKEEDSYIQVRKEFYDRRGNLITNNTFEQNDLIVVKISIAGQYDTYVENVAISDILPAGFEIENPRITETAKTEWVYNDKYRGWASYLDIRDDRINMFVDVSKTPQNYYYMVRAVSLGNFNMGPVGADAMYNGEYHSYSGGGKIKIVGKD